MKNKWFDVDYGLHVVFSTAPQGQEAVFEKDIESTYFKKFSRDSESRDFLYSPLKYYLLGDYDLCYITLINNFKFAHRLFEPTVEGSVAGSLPESDPVKVAYDAHTFQSYTGFALDEREYLESLFKQPREKAFCGIINLKLNNGLLIGNGMDLTKAAVTILKERLKDYECVISYTFSWFELSVMLFIDTPEELSDAILEIRSITLENLMQNPENKSIFTNSLYSGLYTAGEERTKINHTGLFADSHTYFGFRSDLINTADVDVIAAFEKQFENVPLKTEIQWQIKPGHGARLRNVIESHPKLGRYFETREGLQHVLGKWDMVIKNKPEEQSILCSYHFLREFHGPPSQTPEQDRLSYHTRRTATHVYLPAHFPVDHEENGKPLRIIDHLKHLAQLPSRVTEANEKLKALKISRNLRIKIFKIFSNYNNGIQDPILFPYFLDFTMFTEYLLKVIEEEFKQSKKKSVRISELEKKLREHVKVFQEGYNVRFLNGYQFENISDFDLDFNSSIQQLLTSYNVLASEYGKMFYKEKDFSRIIQLNNADTTANYLSINFSIHHLTSPEFAFTTLLKEILNHQVLDSPYLDAIMSKYKERLPEIKNIYNDSYLDDLLDKRGEDMNYFIIDCLRFMITFSADMPLFEYWFWSYNFQNASLYNTSGMFNEQQLRIEMLRLMLIREFFNKVPYEIKCPVAELYTYWERHESRVSEAAKIIVQEIKRLTIVIEPAAVGKKEKTYNFHMLLQSIYKSYGVVYENVSPPEEKLTGKLKEMLKVGGEIANLNSFEKKLAFLHSKKKSKNLIKNMDRFIYRFLEKKANLDQGGEIVVLPRDWQTGGVLVDNLEATEKNFAIDPTGGLYFKSFVDKETDSYFKDSATCLLQIIDYAYKEKKDFITGYIGASKAMRDEN